MSAESDRRWSTLAPLLVLASVAAIFAPAAASQSAPETEAQDGVGEVFGAMEALERAVHDPGNATALREAFELNALREENPPGLSVPPKFRGPDTVLRHPQLVCDVNADGHEDVLMTEASGDSTAKLLSGKDGSRIWSRPRIDFVIEAQFQRVSTVAPAYPDNVLPGLDANGDGTCDIVAVTFTADAINVPPVGTMAQIVRATATVHLLNGADGASIWSRDFAVVDTRTAAPPLLPPMVQTRTATGLLTGLTFVVGDNGGRLVFKTTDIVFARARGPPLLPPIETVSYTIAETIHFANFTTGGTLWTRQLPVERDYTRFTWITGATQLLGDAEPEVVLDTLAIRNPRSNELINPLTGRQAFQYGRNMTVLALRGETGLTAWQTIILDEAAFRPNLPLEEQFPLIQWTFARLVPDLTGDGVRDPVASFFAIEAGQPRSLNGRFMTNFKALDGLTGKKVGGDANIRVQGWGFAEALSTTDSTRALLAIGTIDLPTRPQPGATFPSKDVRVTVFNATDGSSRWQYTERFAQDSYVSYQISLRQIRDTLTIADINGDGIREVVTPALYVKVGREQLLVSTQKHEYRVLSGASGAILRTFQAWGGNGFALNCGVNEFVSVSGNARRVDLTTTSLTDPTATKVVHVWADTTVPRAAASGFSIRFLDANCDRTHSNATFYFVNVGLVSQNRGNEVLSLQGVTEEAGGFRWAHPFIPTNPDVLSYLELQQQPWPPESDADVAAGIGGASFLGGFVGAFAFGFARRKRFLATVMGVGVLLLVLVPAMAAPDLPTQQLEAERPELAIAVPPTLDPERPTPDLHVLATGSVEEAVQEVGRALQPSSSYPPFEENSTLTLSYNVGDVTGDGFDDALLDQYCPDFQACPAPGFRFPAVWEPVLNGIQCGPAHRLAVADGKDGVETWSLNLARPEPPGFVTCSQEYVIGILDTPSGTRQVLVYKFLVRDLTWPMGMQRQFEHTLYALDPTNGQRVWEQVFRGTATDTLNLLGERVQRVDTAYITPHIVADGNASAILLLGAGFESVQVSTPPPVVTNGPLRLVETRQAGDWAAKVLPDGGRIVWRQTLIPTSSPRAQRIDWIQPYAEDPNLSPTTRMQHYWRPSTCCGDLNGDGIEDVVFALREQSATPTTNADGPKFVDQALLAVDGANGQPLYRTPIGKDLDQAFALELRRVGDINHDKADDLILVRTRNAFTFERALQLLDGRTGNTLWNLSTPRNFGTWLPGDADSDGVLDLLIMEWFDHPSFTALIDEPYTNVTKQTLRLYSGATGKVIWTAHTIAAAIDAVQSFDLLAQTGFPDLDNDGMGDLTVDRPLFLADLTVIHQHQFISGRTAAPLRSFVTAGAFVLPASVGDLNRDDHDEFGLLTGDIIDLWFSAYDGKTGQAIWSRRVFTPRIGEYFLATPQMRTETMRTQLGPSFLANFHIMVDTIADTIVFGVTVNGEGVSQSQQTRITATYPRLALFGGQSGEVAWVMPQFYDENATIIVDGATPASALYSELLVAESAGLSGSVFVLTQGLTTLIASGSGLFGATSGVFVSRRLFR